MRLYDTARGRGRRLRPRAVVTMYIVRHHALRLRPPRPRRGVPDLRRAPAPAARPRARDPAACATSPTSTTTSCARPASSASTTSTWPPRRWPASTPTWRPSACCPSTREPRATSAIPDILSLIGAVLDAGHAYQSGGAVYFDVSSFPRFGQVSHLVARRDAACWPAEHGGNPDDPNKRDPLDFVLWQPSLPDEPAWESRWGPGRPGWHIECSALALRELGETDRPPRRGTRPRLPAPRVRGGPVASR